MVVCNCQFLVKVLCYVFGIFCLISPNLPLSKGLSLLHRLYSSCLIGTLLYSFQYYVRGKFIFLYPNRSILFIVMDLLDFGVPHLAVLASVIYATFLKNKTFLVFYNKFVESDRFLGKRYSKVTKMSLLLLFEFLSLLLFYIFYFCILTDFVNRSYGIYYPVPRDNISYCLATILFLFSICCVRVFIVLIITTLSGTNKKLRHSIEGKISFSCYEKVPNFFSNFEIVPFLIQYKTCFKLIRLFNEYFGLQVFFVTCLSFIVLINNMYLSTIKLQGTALESIPSYILFFRHITNVAMYLVRILYYLRIIV